MLRELRLTNFKNFRQATLSLGPLTVLVGTNASGKSNLRDAFRFLHGIARGYTLAEILGEKFGDGGQLEWNGIRGGVREAAFVGEGRFALEVDADVDPGLLLNRGTTRFKYRIEVDIGEPRKPRIRSERLEQGTDGKGWFLSVEPDDDDAEQIVATVREGASTQVHFTRQYSSSRPAISQLIEDDQPLTNHGDILAKADAQQRTFPLLQCLKSMRFVDFSPAEMKRPAPTGLRVLGDEGQNLSSVVQAICESPKSEAVLLDWIGALTPMDAARIEFPEYAPGRVLLHLVERDDRRTSANSASDGTLRFLGFLAAFLGPEPARFHFFEELENGIHPVRLALLIEFLERRAAESNTQVVATTHSPQLLAFLNKTSREHVSVVYRLPDASDGRIKRVVDIPEVKEVLETHSWARLHESGWFENAVHFTEPESAGAP